MFTRRAIDARGVAFPGVNLFVQLGHGRDYAWSATSAGQDIVDTFAVPLCEPTAHADGARRTTASAAPAARSRCSSGRTNGARTPADQTPAGSETLRAERTALGHRDRARHGQRQAGAFTRLRAPTATRPTRGSASRTSTTRDGSGGRATSSAPPRYPLHVQLVLRRPDHIAYQNSGDNPVARGGPTRASRVGARLEWRELGPDLRDRADVHAAPRDAPAGRRPELHHELEQQAGAAATAPPTTTGATGRSTARSCWPTGSSADPRRGARRRCRSWSTRWRTPATVDLRGDAGAALRAARARRRRATRGCRRRRGEAARLGRSRRRTGSTATATATYEHAEAVRIIDAWWPRWMEAEFEPALGKPLFERDGLDARARQPPEQPRRPPRLAWQGGWYGFAQKDLRTLLAAGSAGRWSRVYCGGSRNAGQAPQGRRAAGFAEARARSRTRARLRGPDLRGLRVPRASGATTRSASGRSARSSSR